MARPRSPITRSKIAPPDLTPEQLIEGRTIMRVLIIGAVLLMSSASVPSLAQDQQKSPGANQPSMTAVQPERNPQESEQSREQDRRAAEDVQVGRDWRAQQQKSPVSNQPSTTV